MLSAQQVTYRINGKKLVHNVSLDIQAGEVLALVGPNGAGKSTLLHLLSGDFSPTSGAVLLDDKPLTHYAARDLALRRAVMMQGAGISFDFTVQEVAMMGRYPHQGFGAAASDEDQQVVEAALQRTETDHLRDRFFATLSGGEAARVTLARVLAQETPILLLDEPTAALDLRHQQLIMKITRELAAAGAAILVVLHDLNLAALYADRVGMMLEGDLVALGTPNEVLTAAQIESVFDLPVMVLPHPKADCPLIVPLEPR